MRKKPTRRSTDIGAYESFYEETKGFEPVRDLDFEHGSGLFDAETKAIIDATTIKNLFYSEEWVYITVSKYASRIAGQKLIVVKKGEKEATPHPVQAILNSPNDKQDYYQFMYTLVTDLTLLGNGIAWKKFNQLFYIPSETVNLRFVRAKPVFYEVVRSTNEEEYESVIKIPFDEVAHAKRPNPSSVYWGLSPFVAGRKSILFNRYSSEFLNNYYIKGAQPGLIIELLEGANEKEALRLLRGMELSYTGRKNQRRNMVLPKGVKATPAQTTLADQQLKDYIALNREVILNLLEVPKHEVSLATSGSLGSEEYKTATRNFWRGPLRSTMDSIAGVLNKVFAYELQGGFEIIFDLSDVEALQDDEMQKALLAEKLKATLTVNEIRERLYKMPPVDGGDSVGGAPSAPMAFSATPEPEPAPVAELVTEVVSPTVKNMERFTTFKSQDPKWFEERERVLKENFDKASKGVRSNFLKVLADQVVAVLPIVKDSVKIEKDVYSKAKLKKKITAALDKFESDYVNGNIKELEATLDVGYNSMLKVPFNLPNEEQIAAAKARNKARRKQRLEDQQIETFANINTTTTNKILKAIEFGIESQQTIQEITSEIKSQLIDVDVASNRAETIARTEVLTASSLGQSAAMQDAASVIPNMKKLWINAGDERVRGNPGGLYPESKADHWILQGEVRDYDKKFSNGLMFPRDPSGQAHDVINCRCSFIMIPAEDANKIGLE